MTDHREPGLAQLFALAVEAVDRAAMTMVDRAPGRVTMKGDRDPATEVDYAIERDVRDFLAGRAPGVGFLGEEDGRFGNGRSDHVWALDPVDGTVNFLHGLPLCGVSLGLVRNGTPVAGAIALPFLGSRYSAVAGGGAVRDGRPIRARGERLADAVVAVGDFAVGRGAEAKNVDRVRIVGDLARAVQRVRMVGSAAVDLAWVAEGRIAASVMLANKPWDTAAGVLLAREAGAVVVDRHGRPHTMRSDSTVAVAPALRDALVDVIAPYPAGSDRR